MAAKKNMSVEEILAACRQADGGGATVMPPTESPPTESAASTAEPVAASESTEVDESTASGVSASASSGEKPGDMSVAEMLAAARGEKSAKKPVAKPAAAKPGKAKPGTDKTSPRSPTQAKSQVPKDTMSILAAARKPAKPGPMSKADAEAQGKAKAAAPDRSKPKIVAPPMPEKPVYAVARPADPVPSDKTRRGFFATVGTAFMGSFLAIGFSSLGLTNALWVLGLARFMFPNIRIEPPSAFRVGFPDDFAPGQVETKFKAQFGVWLVRDEYEGQTQIFALKSVCTHLGCTPNWLEGEQKFKCPCHGSGFYKDGINFEGPAPRPLERYAIALASDGQLVVDRSKKFNEEKGQWTDPASFVPV